MNQGSLHLTWLVARREIRLRAKARVFVVTTAILLIAVALAVALPAILSGHSGPDRIGVVGASPTVNGIVTEAGKLSGGQAVAVPEASLASAEAALRRGDLSAVLVPGQEIVVKQVPLGGVSGSVSTLAQLAGLSKLVQTVPGAAAAVAHGVTLPVRGLEAPSTPLSSRLTGLFTVVIVWVLISVYGSQIALGIGEEKSSRVVEVLLSAVRPVQLLIGKVLGIGLLALGQAAAMVVVFVIAGFASGSSLVHGATLGVVLVGGVFIVLGYAFYCTAFAAAGSLVSRQSDVNSTIMPVQLPLIVAYALSYTVLYANGANKFYLVLGFLPPTSPIAMPVLYAAGDVPVWQVAGSAVLCAVGTVWMARLAVRIYANSILRTGPRIKLGQAIRESRTAALHTPAAAAGSRGTSTSLPATLRSTGGRAFLGCGPGLKSPYMTISDADAQAAEPAGPARRRPSLRQSFQSLESPAYRAWFASQLLSASGTMTQTVAISWFLLRLTGNSVNLGLMGSCTFLPVLLLSPHAGALVDRVDRRRLLIGTQAALGLIAAAAAAVIASGVARAWMLFLIAAVTGAVSAPDATARQVYVVDLVGRERVASAIGLYEVILNVSRVAGPAVGGALLATVGVAACCAVNAASYLVPLIVLLIYKTAPATTDAGLTADPPPAAAVSLRAGISYAWRHGPIRICLALAAASGLLFGLGYSLPALATRTFHVGGGGYGLMMCAFGIGALPGALLAAGGHERPTGRRVGWLALATAAAIGATALAPLFWLAIAGLAVVGCLSIWFIAAANTLVQLATAPGMRGRMMGLWTMALPGTQVVNGPLAGWVTQDAGPREGFSLSGMALAAVALAGWRVLTAGPVTQDVAFPLSRKDAQ